MLWAAGENKKMRQAPQPAAAAAATAGATADTDAADHLEEDEDAFEG